MACDNVVDAYHQKNMGSIRPRVFAPHIGEIYTPPFRNLLHFFGSSTLVLYACKDALCVAPPKVTQMIFAVLEDWYHHILLTHSYKQASFVTYIQINTTPEKGLAYTIYLSKTMHTINNIIIELSACKKFYFNNMQ